MIDLDDRELCPDGSCIGLIGPDGKCKVCGATGKAPSASAPVTDEEDESSALEPPPVEAAPASAPDEEGFDEDRELCPDGTCIGVIGSDGHCKVCGAVARR